MSPSKQVQQNQHRKRPLTPEDREAQKRLQTIWFSKAKPKGYTQTKFAEVYGCDPSAVNHWINGRTALGTEAILQFAAFLGVSPYEIKPDFKFSMASMDLRPETRRRLEKLAALPEQYQANIEHEIDVLLKYVSMDKEGGTDEVPKSRSVRRKKPV